MKTIINVAWIILVLLLSSAFGNIIVQTINEEDLDLSNLGCLGISLGISLALILFLYIYYDSPRKCNKHRYYFGFLALSVILSLLTTFFIADVNIWTFIFFMDLATIENAASIGIFNAFVAFFSFLAFTTIGRKISSSLVHYPYFGRGA
ncbi:MAG: hypothetical protein LBC64_03235 [Fibromonadaceae bacterium]|jgi:hypothetical protein|nr:hypothetical protein [Fibromonadaceae bacterium]